MFNRISKRNVLILTLLLILIFPLTGCTEDSQPASAPKPVSEQNYGQLNIYDSVTTMGKVDLPQAEPGTYTILVYLNGSDLESKGGNASRDLVEMMAVGSTDKVKVLVQTGGTSEWYIPEIDSRQNQRWLVNNDSMEKLEDVGKVNMGNPQTLYDFLVWGMQNYPAEKISLVCWNHGAGSIWGYAVDELHQGDSLLLNELKSAVAEAYQSTGKKLNIIGFDACLMATLETASMLSPYADYLIASEESEPAHGWDYTSIFKAVTSDSQISEEKLGKVVLDSYKLHADSLGTSECITLSILDLSKTSIV